MSSPADVRRFLSLTGEESTQFSPQMERRVCSSRHTLVLKLLFLYNYVYTLYVRKLALCSVLLFLALRFADNAFESLFGLSLLQKIRIPPGKDALELCWEEVLYGGAHF